MIKVVIVEDETLAQKKLERFIKEYDTNIEIIAKLSSVRSAVKWFTLNASPDLIFMDIRLEDGLSFDIIEATTIHAPVVFTTAYDEYTINAFKANGIDYLLKPITAEDLKRSFDKYRQLKDQFSKGTAELKDMLEGLLPRVENYKTRFLINEGTNLLVVQTDEIAYFFAENKYSFLVTRQGKQHLVDQPLDKLCQLLDPKKFYRINRQYIVSTHAIDSMLKYSPNKLRLNLSPSTKKEIFVSMEKYTDFKMWLDS